MMTSFYSKVRNRAIKAASRADPVGADTGVIVQRVKSLFSATTTPKSSMGMVWVGWSGLEEASADEESALRVELESRDCIPVFVAADACSPAFDGFCNDVLWPLMHGEEPGLGKHSIHGYNAQVRALKSASFDVHMSQPSCPFEQWQSYVAMNQAFAEEVIANYRPGDEVFVNDFHLMLLPKARNACQTLMPSSCIQPPRPVSPRCFGRRYQGCE